MHAGPILRDGPQWSRGPITQHAPSRGCFNCIIADWRAMPMIQNHRKPCNWECRARSAKFWMSPSTKGSIKQRMVQNAFGPVHKSLHTTCLKITHRVLILATGRSRGHTKDWIVTLENGPFPSQPLRAQYARNAHTVQELPPNCPIMPCCLLQSFTAFSILHGVFWEGKVA